MSLHAKGIRELGTRIGPQGMEVTTVEITDQDGKRRVYEVHCVECDNTDQVDTPEEADNAALFHDCDEEDLAALEADG